MVFAEILLIAIGLSADAFSVSVGDGMCMPKAGAKSALAVGFAFGGFQALMPALGWLAGSAFAGHIEAYDHIVALVLLGFIGGRMIVSGVRAYRSGGTEPPSRAISAGALVVQAVATSIDALACGVGFAAVGLTAPELARAVILIGAITFGLSYVGVYAGRRFGALLGPRAEIVGGAILVGIGVKIFLDGVIV
jgi:putative Mn2+ efflux pump MntP